MIYIALIVAILVAVYIYDRYIQRSHAILHNFPIIGRFRYITEHYGKFMRQYQYTEDWAERPFNRLTRSWIYRKAKGVNANISFGSEVEPTYSFTHSMFPMEADYNWGQRVVIGEHGPNPYKPNRIFNISGMSYGAISSAAVTALSKGASEAGIWLNTGEGGLSKYHLSGACHIVFQIGTAKYGCRDENGKLSNNKLRDIAENPNVKMFEIKLAQGAKPGKGGILPAIKVTPEIAEIRGIPVYEASISPNSHAEIRPGNFNDLVNFIYDVKQVVQKPVGIKMVYGKDHETDQMIATFKERDIYPDFITLDGAEGGTGSAPAVLANHTGILLMDGLPRLHKKLKEAGIRDKIKIIASGKAVTPSSIAKALCLGADFVVSARGFLFSLGCIQAMRCGEGNCPTGIASAKKRLISGLNTNDKGKRVGRYGLAANFELEMLANSCGHISANDLTEADIEIK